MSDEIKKLVLAYHRLDPTEVESLLAPDFVARGLKGFSWRRADHVNFTNAFKGHDEIQEIVVDGNNVAVRFQRTGTFGSYKLKNHEYAHFMKIENGKIIEMYELWDEFPKPSE